MGEADPSSLAAATRLRSQFSPEDAAWALTQTELRRRAVKKFPRASDMLFTRAGLEQATRYDVARWRAERLVEAGVAHVMDLGCGIAADAMAMAEQGLKVEAVDADLETVDVASHNLALVGAGPARYELAEDVVVPEGAGVFMDPARRTNKGRTWNTADFSPPWALVERHLSAGYPAVVKLGPGLPKEMIPPHVEAVWVSHHGDVVEVSLWNQHDPGRVAVVMDRDGIHTVSSASPAEQLRAGEAGRFISEPDNAVIRAGLLDAVAPGSSARLLAESVAYLTSDEPLKTPLARDYEVLDVLDLDVKRLRQWVKRQGIGALEIKVRALDIDPAELRRQLKPRGDVPATLILARTIAGSRAFVVKRCTK